MKRTRPTGEGESTDSTSSNEVSLKKQQVESSLEADDVSAIATMMVAANRAQPLMEEESDDETDSQTSDRRSPSNAFGSGSRAASGEGGDDRDSDGGEEVYDKTADEKHDEEWMQAIHAPVIERGPGSTPLVSAYSNPEDDTQVSEQEKIRTLIFQFLDCKTLLCVVSRVSKTWRNTSLNPEVWRQVNCYSLRSVLNNHIVTWFSERWSQCERLSLMECYDVTDPGIDAIARRCPNLRRIDLTGCNLITNQSMASLGKHCNKIETVDITCCRKITSAGMASLSRGVPELRNLKLWGCALIEDEGLIAVARNCPKLEGLDITWCKSISEHSFAELSKRCTNLKRLNVTWCEKIKDACMQDMWPWPSLEVLFMDGCGRLSNEGMLFLANKCQNLRMVKARFLTKISPHVMAQFVAKLPHLRKLDIRNCDLIERRLLRLYHFKFDQVETLVTS